MFSTFLHTTPQACSTEARAADSPMRPSQDINRTWPPRAQQQGGAAVDPAPEAMPDGVATYRIAAVRPAPGAGWQPPGHMRGAGAPRRGEVCRTDVPSSNIPLISPLCTDCLACGMVSPLCRLLAAAAAHHRVVAGWRARIGMSKGLTTATCLMLTCGAEPFPCPLARRVRTAWCTASW